MNKQVTETIFDDIIAHHETLNDCHPDVFMTELNRLVEKVPAEHRGTVLLEIKAVPEPWEDHYYHPGLAVSYKRPETANEKRARVKDLIKNRRRQRSNAEREIAKLQKRHGL